MKKFKRIKALLLSLSVAVSAVFCGFAMTACNEGNSGNGDVGNGDSNGGTNNEIVTPEKPLALTTSVETNENGENTYTINAIVNPSTLTPRWSITWENSASEWAQDKDTADYFNLGLSNGDKTATLSTKQAFGETAVLTATISSPTGEVSVSCRLCVNRSFLYNTYDTSDGTYCISGFAPDCYFSETDILFIPSYHRGVRVTRIKGLSNQKWVRHVEIQEGVKYIDIGCFRGCSFESIDIPLSVFGIGDGALEACSNLKKIVYPAGVSRTQVASSAFENCISLTDVTLPQNTTHIRGSAFKGCTSLASIDFHSALLGIEYDAFNGCTLLNNVIIPASVIEIGARAFKGCTSLSKVTFLGDKSKIKIAEDAFEGCPYQP